MNLIKKCEYRNGVRRPLKGATAKVWETIEKYIEENGYTPSLEELYEISFVPNFNTVRTNLCLFLKYHGIETRRGDLKNGRSFVIRETDIVAED